MPAGKPTLAKLVWEQHVIGHKFTFLISEGVCGLAALTEEEQSNDIER